MALIDRPIGIRAANLTAADDRARIDAYVLAHANATPFHLTAWSVAVMQGCGQAPHYLVAETADGGLCGVLPLTEVASPLFGRAMVSVGFGVGGGPLADSDLIAANLAEAAWQCAVERRCPTLEIRGAVPAHPGWHADDTTYVGFSRALATDDDAELTAIPRKQRAEVRKALANNLSVTIGRHDEDLKLHYTVYAQSVRNLGTPVFPAELFRAVLHEFGESADILVVRDKGRAVAGVLSLYMNGTVFPYWGGGTASARALRANDAMYFALMRHARERGCTRFDFGRSKIGTGAAAFKKNWGFEGVPLSYSKRSMDGMAPRDINPMNPKYRAMVAVWQRLPLWAANLAGPFISKGLG